MASEPVWSLEEAAHRLGETPPGVLLDMARAKKIGSLKVGRTWTFPQSVLDDYVEAHTTRQKPVNPGGLTDAALRRLNRGDI
jgi:excisionase family DNA binding protein